MVKWVRFFLLLCLIPGLIHASFDSDYAQAARGVSAEWKQHEALVQQFNGFKVGEQEQNLGLIRKAIACCEQAARHCDTVLGQIAKLSRVERPAWAQVKKQYKQNKNAINDQIGYLQRLINSSIAFGKATSLHQESEKKATLANQKNQNCSRRLNNVEEVVSNLGEVSKLYEEASLLAFEALNLISLYPDEESKNTLRKAIERYQAAASKYKKDAADWPAATTLQKAALQERLVTLKEERRLFEEKNLKRSSYEIQKQTFSVLEQIIESSVGDEGGVFKEELEVLKSSIAVFEAEADRSRLTKTISLLSAEEFSAREKERRELFFKNNFLLTPELFFQSILHNEPRPSALPLDGQVFKKDTSFTLYAEQFYRFLVQSDTSVSEIVVKVYEKGEIVYEETITLPVKNTQSWERYLLADGMTFIPETKLKTDFGLWLRFSFVCDPRCNFSMVIAQKCNLPNYQFSFSLKDETPLYTSKFLKPPPWQLSILQKPVLPTVNRPMSKKHISCPAHVPAHVPAHIEESFPTLDEFVEQLKKDPLALAGYVYNEIALDHRFLFQVEGVFQAPGIRRNAHITFLEKQGSPWEQCQLLVYLLRKAGYQALYVTENECRLPKVLCERMLFTRLPEGQGEGLLQYPSVLFFDGKEWISLFPWMKEMQVQEGYDLYNFMPEEYATADRWILRYLKGDERILKQIGSDRDDTLGSLFVQFVKEELRKQGLSLSDVGIHRTQIKKQFSSWVDFPRPLTQGAGKYLDSLPKDSTFFSKAHVEIFSHQNPHKKISHTFPLVDLNCNAISLWFAPQKESLYVHFIGEEQERQLDLDKSDQVIDIKIYHEHFMGLQFSCSTTRNISMPTGTEAALCFHVGGESAPLTSQFYQQFSSEKDEKKRLQALLAFVGAAYFEKCSRAQEALARLHKFPPVMDFAIGLVKLSSTDTNLKAPQVDMIWASLSSPTQLEQEIHETLRQLQALIIADASSNEHQVLLDVFGVDEAISTVKLLQLASREQQKKGLPEPGFLGLTPSIITAAENTPEATKSLCFSQLKDLNLRNIEVESSGQWELTKKMLGQGTSLDTYAYAYMTPGLISSPGSSYKEMGTLIFHPHFQGAFISGNNLITNGGLGSPFPKYYFSSPAIKEWRLIPSYNSNLFSYTLYVPSPKPPTLSSPSWQGTKEMISDVRPEHKSWWQDVSDPVDVITGAFYIDEVDLVLPGPFPFEIRRNYNSQNPLIGDLGCGWKLSLNPALTEQDGKLYAAEADGTVIAYSYNQETSRWEVFPKDNPDLYNINRKGIGSTANPFHAYIENDILYGSDGSRRIFENGLLKQWINSRGNTLTFFYSDKKLSRIESSNGDFCGLLYNHEGKISEIYAKDGRRISYNYNSHGDLVKVTLPNTAVTVYEYDHLHRIIRETKPHGKVLENIYKEGKVQKQRSPMGQSQTIITTATFDYQDGVTTVIDGGEGKTTYKIFQKQIYKITDPLGHQILQSWFIDKESWFDPITEKITKWSQPGGAHRCLKAITDKRGLTTFYLYDTRGNPLEIGLQGEDLTGDGESLITKKFIYNDRNLCTQEETHGQKTLTTYDETFPYLPKKIETYNESTLISYVDLTYNAFGQVEKEDSAGSITCWKYDTRGFPSQKNQETATGDPDVVTYYSHNNQGQCSKIVSADTVRENSYDIMGNQIESKTFSPSGTLLSATYIGYDLNCAPIWKQTANQSNTTYLDYHASGLVKASRQTSYQGASYTLYEYDSRGYLIEEVDPLGYTTYRDYDALGQITCETKEKLSTFLTYEPGGLPETITTPSGAKTTRLYTTNGLLKEEIFPDGTKNSIIYDFFGRPVQETKNDISWKVEYDEAHRRVVRTQLKTKTTEISEFDASGNLILFTDAASYTLKKSYDGLNRIKTETTPTGEQTEWNYQEDLVICTLPSGETTTSRYEGGQIVESETTDPQGNLIAQSSFHYDPETDIQTVIQGEEVTTTWISTLGLPLKVQKGATTTTYTYDRCGNCVAITDGDGRITSQAFDGLRRLIQKQLPDGSLTCYAYDLDSNLTEYHLPNGAVWKASYDSMGRKKLEELQAGKQSSLRWEYRYEKGYLKEAKDPMHRTHTYEYELSGRLSQEAVPGGHRAYTYDPRGLITKAEQTTDRTSSWLSSWVYGSSREHSLIERSYDPDGRLSQESIYLNSNLIQHTKQEWTASSRSLQTSGHTRDFTYQNRQLIQVSTKDLNLSYTYDLTGSLKSKSTPWSTTVIDYNSSGLPEHIQTRLPDGSHQESLEWYPSAKLLSYSSPTQQKQFTYTARGHLQDAGAEKYEFDFGVSGTGVRTEAPGSMIVKLDAFGKILTEMIDQNTFPIIYNPMGEVISQGPRHFEWDPWGRLIKVSQGAFTWEASYDPFGRRLQTRYTPANTPTLTITSLYDPEEEFQEIGVQYGGKTFWKIYGPSSCDAITDETGDTAILIHSALDQLTSVISRQGTFYNEQLPSSYGSQTAAPIPTDLLSYAKSLAWHSQAQDPTGLIWMGARYYDPQGGRFLSPDPLSYPVCLDLYAYSAGDPVNFIDPDGRFASSVYKLSAPATISDYGSTKYDPCGLHVVGKGKVHPKLGFGFANGMRTSLDEAKGYASLVQKWIGGYNVDLQYNSTEGISADLRECRRGLSGEFVAPMVPILQSWDRFFDGNPNGYYIQYCHSQGVINVRNCLQMYPEHRRNRIIVLAVGPAAYIDQKLCLKARHFISENDFYAKKIFTQYRCNKPLTDKNNPHVTYLKAHKRALRLTDHRFDSLTISDPLYSASNKIIRRYENEK